MLARAGLGVTLIEQHVFPRDKVCGECLSALGIDVLERHGLGGFPHSQTVLSRTLIHAVNGTSCEFDLPRQMWGISRRVLDAHLLDMAKSAGVRVLQPARCEAISPAILVRHLPNKDRETIDAAFVLRADGKPPDAHQTGDFGIKTHFEHVDGPADAIELFGVQGSYGGLAPIENGLFNAAFSVPAERLRTHRGDIDALFTQIVGENRTLSQRLRHARRAGSWLASPLPRFAVQREWLDKVIPIGNAACAIEPIGGEGMGLALRSAELAAHAVIEAAREGSQVRRTALRQAYQQLWGTRAKACRALALAASHARFCSWLVPAVNGCDSLGVPVMYLMGK
jgi:2-polyprenyl-6-methoxyphenol hydroxylase-like FAD-dependent oxidoreductase